METPRSPQDSPLLKPARLPRQRRLLGLCAAATLLCAAALALALGLGLGLGLKHHHSSSAGNTTSTATGAGDGSGANGTALPQVQPAKAADFVVGGVLGQPPQTRFFEFVVGEASGAPDGVAKDMLVVNGQFPGPTIEANQGDRIVVNVTNTLPNATSIHWHGLFQNQTNFYDGTAGITECGIPPGGFLVYNFTLGAFSGTTWWHALGTQYTDGLTGALVVHPSAPAPAGFPAWEAQELVLQMGDLYHTPSSVLVGEYLSPYGIDGTPGDEPVPDAGTLNGLGQWGGGGDYFNYTLEPNKTYRLRLINTGSFASIRFSLDHHPLTLIEVDGTLVRPTVVSGVTLAVAQRYSVLVHTNASQEGGGAYWMRAAVQTDMFTYDEPGMNADVRGVVRYSGVGQGVGVGVGGGGALPSAGDDPGLPGLLDLDTSQLVPAVADVPPKATKRYTVSVSLENSVNGQFLGFMNGTSWAPLLGTTTLLNVASAGASGYMPPGGAVRDDQFVITEEGVEVVDLLINNIDDGDHPFHFHGHRPYIMGTGPGQYLGEALNEANPVRRDTFLIPAYNWMIVRFVTDNPGVWAFHCHLVWHMAAGLLMQFSSQPSVAAQLPIPQAIVDQCKVATSIS